MNPYEQKRREIQRLKWVTERSKPPFICYVSPFVVFFHEWPDSIEVSVYTNGGAFVKEEMLTADYFSEITSMYTFYDWYANKIVGEILK